MTATTATEKQPMRLKKILEAIGFSRAVIGGFFLLMLLVGTLLDLSLALTFGDILKRIGTNGVLVLAMVPSIQSGIGPNFALPVGITCGLLGMVLAIEMQTSGMGFIVTAMVIGSVAAVLVGYAYGKLLNSIKGSEMAIATYTGFAVVALMCIVWLTAPLRSPAMKWFMGDGLRDTLQLENVSANGIFNKFLAFQVGELVVPTGLLLVLGLFSLLVWLFLRTKTGIAVSTVGNSARFAHASGLHIDRNRLVGNILSTVLGALGIIVYAQSYGFVQLYTAPLMMAFPAVAAILIGGATPHSARVSHVFIGTLLFQGLLATAMPVANEIFSGTDLSEMIRMVVQNGIILYALCQAKGGGRS